MADFMVGKSGAKAKDRYMVGYNESKSNASAYKVGGGGSQVSQSDNKKLGGGQLDPVVGSKSAFSYSGELDVKDIGDRGDNTNMGGSISSGIGSDPTGPGGQDKLNYSIKGDWSDSKNAIARRKAQADAAKQYMNAGSQYDSPTVDLVNIKK